MSRRRLTVAFDTAGGHRSGVGHLLRSIVLADQLQRLGATVSVLTPLTNDPLAAAALRNTRLPVSDEGGESPDVVVIDRPDTTSARLRRHHRRWPLARLVALDYYGAHVDGLAGVINLNQARDEKRRTEPHWQCRGLAYATLRASFAEWRRIRRKPPARVRRILVGFGGTDPLGWSSAAVDVLSGVVPSHVSIQVLAGRPLALNDRSTARSAVTCHIAVADPAPLLHGSDLAVIGGGTMMIEAACLGVPALVLPRTWEERVFARQFTRVGAVRALQTGAGFPFAALRREMTRLLDDRSARFGMRRAGRKLVDGCGAERVAKVIFAAGGLAA